MSQPKARIDYCTLREEIKDLPQALCPAILYVLVRICVRKKVFQPSELEHIVQLAIKEENESRK